MSKLLLITDKSELTQLLPDSSVRVQCPKTGSWENIATVLEMRPGKLSYLIEVQGKMFVTAHYMLRPVEEGGVFLNQDQVQGGARSDKEDKESPRRSERLKEKVSVSKSSLCVPQKMVPPNSGSTAGWTGSKESKLQSRWRSRTNPTPSASTQGVSPFSTSNGRVLPLAHWPFSLSRSSPS